MQNVHERVIAASPEEVGALLDTLGSRDDRLWPLPPRAPMVLRGALGVGPAVGASGGHGSVRYTVVEYVPGRRITFRFTPAFPMVGTHTLTVDPAPGGALIRHELVGRPLGALRVLVPLVVRWMHDCYVEDAFDRAERQLGVGPAKEHRHSRWMPLLERRLARRVETAEPVLTGAGATALPKVDFADAFSTDLLPGDGTDPVAWQAAVFAAAPGWVRGLMAARNILMRPFGVVTGHDEPTALFGLHDTTATECVVGLDDKHLDFRVVTTVDEPAALVTLTTVVRVHSRLGKAYWSLVRFFHPVVLRSLMRRTAHPAGVEGAHPRLRAVDGGLAGTRRSADRAT